MKENNVIDLRLDLEKMPSEQLEEMLRMETEKEIPDDDLVLQLLHILEKRNADKPVELSPKAESAWNTYKKRVSKRAKRHTFRWDGVIKAATFIAVIGVLFAIIPQKADAESLWEKLMRLTESVVEFFGVRDNDDRIEEYVFETDNPGLQQIYDAAVELGVMVPVVPMWLPEGYELAEVKTVHLPSKVRLYSYFEYGNSEIVYYIDIYHVDVSHKYQKDEGLANEYELCGVKHYILENNSRTTAVWTRENVECSIFIECREDTLHRIIKSIYAMEDKK